MFHKILTRTRYHGLLHWKLSEKLVFSQVLTYGLPFLYYEKSPAPTQGWGFSANNRANFTRVLDRSLHQQLLQNPQYWPQPRN